MNLGTDIHEAFKAVRCFNNNVVSIDRDMLALFLERNGQPLPIPADDLAAMIRRYDRDGDSRISYKEFERAMMPMERLEVRQPIEQMETIQINSKPIVPWNQSTNIDSVQRRGTSLRRKSISSSIESAY